MNRDEFTKGLLTAILVVGLAIATTLLIAAWGN